MAKRTGRVINDYRGDSLANWCPVDAANVTGRREPYRKFRVLEVLKTCYFHGGSRARFV